MIWYCRFCGLASKNQDSIHLFNHCILMERSYNPAEIVNLVFKGIEVIENDDLSKEICFQCLNNTVITFRFYSSIKSAKLKLEEILKQKLHQTKGRRLILPAENKEHQKPPPNLETYSNETRLYDCFECAEKFRAFRQLKKHEDEMHKPAQNLCNFCNKWFAKYADFQTHLITHHSDSKFKCLRCDNESFASKHRLFKHYKKKHSKSIVLKCTACAQEMFERSELKSHIEKFHWDAHVDTHNQAEILDIKLEPCLEDSTVDTIKEKKENDIKLDQQDIDTLDEVMDEEFLDEFFLNQHGENTFEFNECWDALGLNFDEDIRIKMSDLENEIPPSLHGKDSSQNMYQYQCPHCKKGFAKQVAILIHLAQEHNLPVLSCDVCSDKFSNQNDYKLHKINHLGTNSFSRMEESQMEIVNHGSEKLYMCKACRRKYKDKINFVLHTCKKSKPGHYIQQPEKPESIGLTCEECQKPFKTKLGLKYHIKAHNGVKSLECPYCSRRFLTKMNLRAHLKAVHSIVKNHLCTLCDRNFATLDHLKKHVMSVHQKERSHLCSVCGKLFSQVSHLKSHFKIHNLEIQSI